MRRLGSFLDDTEHILSRQAENGQPAVVLAACQAHTVVASARVYCAVIEAVLLRARVHTAESDEERCADRYSSRVVCQLGVTLGWMDMLG